MDRSSESMRILPEERSSRRRIVEMSELLPLEIGVTKGDKELQVMTDEEKLGCTPPCAAADSYLLSWPDP